MISMQVIGERTLIGHVETLKGTVKNYNLITLDYL